MQQKKQKDFIDPTLPNLADLFDDLMALLETVMAASGLTIPEAIRTRIRQAGFFTKNANATGNQEDIARTIGYCVSTDRILEDLLVKFLVVENGKFTTMLANFEVQDDDDANLAKKFEGTVCELTSATQSEELDYDQMVEVHNNASRFADLIKKRERKREEEAEIARREIRNQKARERINGLLVKFDRIVADEAAA
jgi:hypothetical protein